MIFHRFGDDHDVAFGSYAVEELMGGRRGAA